MSDKRESEALRRSRIWQDMAAAEEVLLKEIASQAYPLTALIDRLKPRMNETLIREAIWDLINRGKAELTWDRRVKAVTNAALV